MAIFGVEISYISVLSSNSFSRYAVYWLLIVVYASLAVEVFVHKEISNEQISIEGENVTIKGSVSVLEGCNFP